ncbi:ExeA family protein [Neptuniibacter halophilus]|uniref:ExeA family protein n=1 Tax=Neptuniibacter halophilus TaxID=651666 RepID=UPI0025724FC2|nr:AAA family ATPase [Neptuniibacter halophilus]
MYTEHFGLNELPFSLTPNTHFFLNLPTHHEALNLILVALAGGDGFVKVVGEVGTGKTLLCRKLLNALDGDEYVTAYIPNPNLNPDEFRKSFAQEIGVPTEGVEQFELLNAINHRLIELAAQQKKVVLLVDEAQATPADTIEALRLLTNLETESAKLFQVVLFGQPELDELLSRKSLRQLLQRITFSYQLSHLDQESVQHYIDQRVQLAGFQGLSLFKRDAAKKIAQASAGTPRLINILSHKALMSAYGKGDLKVDKRHVLHAIDDTQGLTRPRELQPLLWAGVATLALLTGYLVYSGVGL